MIGIQRFSAAIMFFGEMGFSLTPCYKRTKSGDKDHKEDAEYLLIHCSSMDKNREQQNTRSKLRCSQELDSCNEIK